MRLTNDGDLIISSVSDGNPDDGWTEIQADGVNCIDLHTVDSSALERSSHTRQMGQFITCTAPYVFIDSASPDGRTQKSVGGSKPTS